MKTQVVNRYKEEYDEYIGRGTPAGNPFIVGIDGDNRQCVEKYEKYFYWRISWDEIFKRYIESLRGKKIGCSCKPKLCHGDIICSYLNSMDEK